MNQLDDKIIKTERLVLHPLKATHAEHMFFSAAFRFSVNSQTT
jgi:hypothetical protein